MIQPAFHIERITYVLNIIDEEIHNFIQRLNTLSSGSQINISREMLKLNVSIVNRALFSNTNQKEMESLMFILEKQYTKT